MNNPINIINFNDNITIIKNDAAIQCLCNSNINLLYKEEGGRVTTYENVLLESIKNDNLMTSYNIDHLKCDHFNYHDLKPNADTLNNFYSLISNKNCSADSYVIENGVFLISFTQWYVAIQHVMMDISNSLNMFYDLLVQNPDFVMIIEFIPHGTDCLDYCLSLPGFFDDCNKSIELVTKFIRDLGLTNEIKIISDVSMYQNFDHSLFIKNLYAITFNSNNLNYLHIKSKFCKNSRGNYMGDTLREIIKSRCPKNYDKKYLILEQRFNSVILGEERNLSKTLFDNIYNICLDYCHQHNLELLIWNGDITKNNSIYEQFVICQNAEIIIQTAGSFSFFNYSIERGKILCFDMKPALDCESSYNLCFYNNIQHFFNKNVQNYLHFKDYKNPMSYEKLVSWFLYDNP